jgi:hypothetical protein
MVEPRREDGDRRSRAVRWLALVYPFVFALLPPLALYAHDHRSYWPGELPLPLAGALLLAGLLFVPAALVWRDPHERAFRLFVTLACFYLSGQALARLGGLPIEALGRELDLGALGAWGVGLVGLALLVCQMPAEGPRVTRALGVLSGVLMALVLAEIIRLEAVSAVRPDLELEGQTWSGVRTEAATAEAPHVFYVILDAYARHDVLAEQYGFDNTLFLDALRERGFYVATGSESNYTMTSYSLVSSLNMAYVEDLRDAAQRDGERWSTRRAMAHNLVAQALRTRGYSFVAFSRKIGMREGRGPVAFAGARHARATDSQLLQTFVGLTPLRGIPLGSRGRAATKHLHRARVLHALEAAPELARSAEPVFAFLHVLCPHAPFVFDAEGNDPGPLPGDAEGIRRIYVGQLRYLNELVLDMIDEILAASTRPVLIVLQGDHGPNTGYELFSEDRGTSPHRRKILNAYLFPDREYGRLYETISPVNSFRIVLNQFMGFDLPLLPDRGPGSREEEPDRAD